MAEPSFQPQFLNTDNIWQLMLLTSLLGAGSIEVFILLRT